MTGQGNFDDKFEKEWAEAFEGYEETPPSTVWNEIDRKLTYEQLAAYKRRSRYYQITAAAAVLVAAFLGVAYFFSGGEATGSSATRYSKLDHPKAYSTSHVPIIPGKKQKKETGGPVAGHTGSSQPRPGQAYAFEGDNRDAGPKPDVRPKEERRLIQPIAIRRKEPEWSIAANFAKKEIFPIMSYTYQPAKKSSASYGERFWAGIDVGSGSFDPNYRTAAANPTLASSLNVSSKQYSFARTDAVDTQSPSVSEGMSGGNLYTIGMKFGMKLTDRWVLEGGVQYARAEAVTQTNILLESQQVVEPIPVTSQIKEVTEIENITTSERVLAYEYEDVELDNQFQFASIPLKAGFMIVDKKFNLMLNAGVAANLYLGNKLSDPENQITAVTIGPGADSPYKEVSFQGLAGLQVGYRFWERFDLTVEPFYRETLNSLTKEKSAFVATPSGFGLNTGVRYRFN